MQNSSRQILGCLCVALLGAVACTPRRIPPATVEDLMEDRITLDGIMMKCDQNSEKFRDTQDCENARIATDRLASQNADPSVEKKREQEFERARERLRLAEERERQEQEAKTKVDAYTLPVVPANPPPASNPSATSDPSSATPAAPPARSNDGSAASPPLVGTATP